jgi:hypothetical protein
MNIDATSCGIHDPTDLSERAVFQLLLDESAERQVVPKVRINVSCTWTLNFANGVATSVLATMPLGVKTLARHRT